MKGMVFTLLGELVEERFGIEMWDELIDLTQPESDGAYVSTDTYPDQELLAYVAAMSEKLDVPANDLVFAFGEYMLGKFESIHPEFFEGHDLKSFLKSVHDVIHVEVKKLHPDAVLPTFDYEDPSPDALTMLYRSPRQLCALAEGLIAGAAKHFDTPLNSTHDVCMHRGADHCRIELVFAASQLARSA